MARKKMAAGHHGGAWKVAYADFVTAMMAFFLVLWILGLGKDVKTAIAAYFNDPFIFMKSKDPSSNKPIKVDWPMTRPDLPTPPSKNSPRLGETKGGRVVEKKAFETLKQDLESYLKTNPEFQAISRNVRIEMTMEGMRIDMAEGKDAGFFSPGSGEINANLEKLLTEVGNPLKGIPNKIVVEGHTDAQPTRDFQNSNWELSTERANSARRILDAVGLQDQIIQVRGFAAKKLLVPDDPLNPSNRRISMVVLYSGMENQLGMTPNTASQPGDLEVAIEDFPAATPTTTTIPDNPDRATEPVLTLGDQPKDTKKVSKKNPKKEPRRNQGNISSQ